MATKIGMVYFVWSFSAEYFLGLNSGFLELGTGANLLSGVIVL